MKGMHMRTLYISDLDGTLLNDSAELTIEARDMLNTCIEQGVNFTVSTARTPASVFHILKGLTLNLPISMMNGVLLYDVAERKYLKVATIPKETVMVVLGLIKYNKLNTFMYGLSEGKLYTYYDSVDSKSLNKFRNERILKYDKVFTEVDDLSLVAGQGVIYFTLRERAEELSNILNELSVVKGIQYSYYEDIYNEGLYYLEIYSSNASKKSTVDFLREWGCFDNIVGFGDNMNDFGMFEACDTTYAVANANQQIIDMATGLIPANKDNGVPRYIMKAIKEIK